MTGRYISPQELANIIGIAPRTIRQWCREGRVPHRRFDRLIRFAPEDVKQIIRDAARHPRTQYDEVDTPNPTHQTA